MKTNKYHDVLDKLIGEYLSTEPDIITISTQGFLSDEIIPEEKIKSISQKTLDTQFVKDYKGNFYWPTSVVDVIILLDSWQYFYTVQTRQATDINGEFSKQIDAEILSRAHKDNNTSLIKRLQRDAADYNSADAASDPLIVTLDCCACITEVFFWKSVNMVKSYWGKKYPSLLSLEWKLIK